jgi:hypothetical protein
MMISRFQRNFRRRCHARRASLLPSLCFAAITSVALSGCWNVGTTSERRIVSPWPYLSADSLERAGDRDTAYIRRMRTYEQLVRSVPTDSLAKLYLASIDAPVEEGQRYHHAVACQINIMVRRYGGAAPGRAIRLLEDSLFPTVEAKRRFNAARERWPTSLGREYRCDVGDVPLAPDSLGWWPYKTDVDKP